MPGFQKGHPRVGGRQLGSLNKSTADIKALAFQHCPKAIAFLVSVIEAKTEPTVTKIAAAKELLDRGIGRAAQPQTGADGDGPVEIKHIISWQK